jgi:hypothetical protein
VELIQAGVKHSDIRGFTNSVQNREKLLEQCVESVIVPIQEDSNTDYSNY